LRAVTREVVEEETSLSTGAEHHTLSIVTTGTVVDVVSRLGGIGSNSSIEALVAVLADGARVASGAIVAEISESLGVNL
jgi:hypothetical protein